MPKVHSFDANALDWTAHPQFAGLLIKVLESRATHPHMSMMLVRLAAGGVISTHVHATETETAYVLAGRGVLKLGDNDEVVMEPGRVRQVAELRRGRVLDRGRSAWPVLPVARGHQPDGRRARRGWSDSNA